MFKITGLDEFQRKLERIAKNAEKLDGTHQIPIAELFPPAFMRRHSSLPDFESFARQSGLDFSSQEAVEAIPATEMNSAVRRLTTFGSWDEMRQAAAADWARRGLFDGIGG
jgi:hypothetical protein